MLNSHNTKLSLTLVVMTFFSLLFVSGCAVKTPLTEREEVGKKSELHIAQLEAMLLTLGAEIDRQEAASLAKKSITYAFVLTEKYELVWPPLWHNTLVNIGLKERGLCYQWAEDMLAYLRRDQYKSFDLDLVVANSAEFAEHHALIVIARGSSFEHGILLDPWRNSGELFFIPVQNDKKYEWHLRE